MRLDASDFEAVWQHMCTRALADHAHATLIASSVPKDERRHGSPCLTH
jgi:hypothetical protein